MALYKIRIIIIINQTLNIVVYPTYPDKFIRSSHVVAPPVHLCSLGWHYHAADHI